jgi:hypothetical protein
MTESDYNAQLASGAIKIEPAPEEAAPSESSTSSSSSISVEQFIPLLMALQSTQRCLTAAPTNIPQTFQDQIQFVFAGSTYYLYLYFNNQWNSFAATGGGGSGVIQLLAGFGIALSPGGGTGTVTISCTIDDATLPMSDITTNNVSTSQHGFVPKLPNDATKFLNGQGAFTVPTFGGGSAIATLSGTDSYSGTTPFTVTHTITHAFGKRPTMITISIPTLVSPAPPGSGHTGQEAQGWFTLDTNGNPIAGMYVSYSHVYGGSGVFTLTQAGLVTNSLSSSGSTGGGTGTVSITVNNVTNTTFDIVYTSTDTTGVSFTSPTIAWTVIG